MDQWASDFINAWTYCTIDINESRTLAVNAVPHANGSVAKKPVSWSSLSSSSGSRNCTLGSLTAINFQSRMNSRLVSFASYKDLLSLGYATLDEVSGCWFPGNGMAASPLVKR